MERQRRIDIAALRPDPDPLTPDDVDRIRQRLNSEYGNLQLLASTQLRTLISSAWTTEEDLDFVANVGFLPRLVQFLETENPALHLEVAWILTNLSARTSFRTGVVVDAGAIPALVKLIPSTTQAVSEQVLWALRNIAGDLDFLDYRKMVVQNAVMTQISELIQKPCSLAALRSIAALMSNLCNNGLDVEAIQTYFGSIVQSIFFLMDQADPEIKTYSLVAIAYLTKTKVCTVESIINRRLLHKFPSITENYHGFWNLKMLCTAIRALAILVQVSIGNETALILSFCNTMNASDTLSALRDLLYREIPNQEFMKLDIICLLSNLLGKSEAHMYLQQMIDLKLIPAVLTTLKNAAKIVQKNDIWIIKHFARKGNIPEIEYLLECDLMPTICQLLKTAKHPEVLQESLVSLCNILKAISSTDDDMAEEKRIQFFDLIAVSNGWESIEKIQENKHVGASQAAKELSSEYMKVVKASIKTDSTPMEYENTDSSRIYFHCTRGPIY